MRKLLLGLSAALLAIAGSAGAATNLVTNGNFENGNDGSFTSSYTFVPYPGAAFTGGPADDLTDEGTYTVGSDPKATHPSWIELAGPNKFMIVNGRTSATPNVIWSQNIPGLAAGQYDWSLDLINICCNASYGGPNAPSRIVFNLIEDGGNVVHLLTYQTDPLDNAWKTFADTLTLTKAGTVQLVIENDLNAAGGNDFGLDNISIAAVPEPTTWAMMIGGFGLAGYSLRRRTLATA